MQVLFKDRAKADETRVGEEQKLYRMSSALLLSWNHLQGCVSCQCACSRGSWLAANFSPCKKNLVKYALGQVLLKRNQKKGNSFLITSER
jgi:hypothetical protein